jgi:hypothetical protein
MEPVKKTTTKKRGKFSIKKIFAFSVSPRRQFRLLIIAWVLLLISITAFHGYFLNKIATQSVFQAGAVKETTLPKINGSKLKTVLLRFDDKKVKQADIIKLNPPVENPEK